MILTGFFTEKELQLMAKRFLVGESGGPTPVIDWEVAGALAAAQASGWEAYGMINGLEGLLNANIPGNIVDLSHMDPMAFVFNGPGAGLDTTRIKPKDDQYKKMAENLKALGIDAVVYFGGNDSADQLLGLAKHAGVQVIHGIKTVDNDLPVTHHCPGYGSATLFNATAIKTVHSDYSSYLTRSNFKAGEKVVQGWDTAPAIIYQVMGRKEGWLAQGTGFAKVDPAGTIDPDRPPHIILTKEIPFSKERFLAKADEVISRLGEVVIVVQEDLTDAASGKSIAEVYAEKEVSRDEHGNIQWGRVSSFSTAIFLAQVVTQELKVKAVLGKVKEVALVPQHIQRSYSMSNVDASEAYRVGSACVKALNEKLTKKSVILTRENKGRTITGITELENIAAKDRSVPLEWINGLDGPTQDFVDEFIYLIGGPAAIPHYSKLCFGTVPVPQAIAANPYVKPEKKK